MRIRWVFILLTISLMPLPAQAAQSGTQIAQASAKRAKAKKQKEAGDKFLKAGRKKQAEKAYRRAARLDPNWHEAHEALGNLLFASRKYLKAVESFKKAVKVEPRYATGLYNIAFAYRKARKYKEAAKYYTEYIKRKADDPDAFYGLAATYEALGNNQAAIDNYLLYAQKETRPSERQYVVKARKKAEKLKKAMGLAAAPPPAPAPKPTPAPAPAPAPKPAPAPAAKQPSVTASPPAPAPAPKTAPAPAAKPKPATTVAAATKPPGSSRPVMKPSRPQPVVEDKRVARLLAEGDAAMKKKSYTRAMKAYFDAVQLNPKNTDALYKLGLVYQATGNHKAAQMKWRLALRVDPNHAGARQALKGGSASSRQPSGTVSPPAPRPKVKPKAKPAPPPVATRKPMATRPQPATGQPALQPVKPPAPKTAAATSPPSARAGSRKLMAEGDAYFRQKSYSRAIDAYTRATRMDPQNEEATFKLGVTYAISGNYKVAIYKWQQVLAINPNNKSAKRNIERARTKLKGSSASAQPALVAPGPAAKHPAGTASPPPAPRPVSFESLMARARQMKKKGDAKGVVKLVDQALTIKQDPGALMLRGEALVVLRRYQDAKRAFSKVMVMNPNLAAPFYGLGETCRLSGDQERARYYFKMYVRSRSSDVNPALLKKAKAFLGQ